MMATVSRVGTPAWSDYQSEKIEQAIITLPTDVGYWSRVWCHELAIVRVSIRRRPRCWFGVVGCKSPAVPVSTDLYWIEIVSVCSCYITDFCNLLPQASLAFLKKTQRVRIIQIRQRTNPCSCFLTCDRQVSIRGHAVGFYRSDTALVVVKPFDVDY